MKRERERERIGQKYCKVIENRIDWLIINGRINHSYLSTWPYICTLCLRALFWMVSVIFKRLGIV